MRIQIHDDNENWLNWGLLVRTWIENPTGPRPTTVGDLKILMRAHTVTAIVDGADQRPVVIRDYLDAATDPLVIYIPTLAMMQDKLQTVTQGAYPLPLFYDSAYAGAARANLSAQESSDFASRRIGEYTVNECC